MSSKNVGVIGLGAMGLGVARSLLRAGFRTHACDVRRDVLAAFAAEGGIACATPEELGAACEVVLTLVVNAQQTEGVLLGEQGRPRHALGIGRHRERDRRTRIRRIARGRLAAMGLGMIDAPVSGGAAKAASGQMTVMAAGAPEHFAKVEDVFKAIAQKVYRLGDAPGAGSKVKMINQLLAGVHIAAAAEAMAMGIRAGADPAVLYEVISNSAGSSWMFQNRVPHILAGDYTPLSAVNIFVKDLGIVLDTAKKSAFPLPLTATAHQMFLTAAAAGRGGRRRFRGDQDFPGHRAAAEEEG